MHGLSDDETQANLLNNSSNTARAKVLEFARAIVDKRGWVSDDDLARIRNAGFGDAEITEIVATVAATMFSNYFNHIAQTEVDFPPVKVVGTQAA